MKKAELDILANGLFATNLDGVMREKFMLAMAPSIVCQLIAEEGDVRSEAGKWTKVR